MQSILEQEQFVDTELLARRNFDQKYWYCIVFIDY